MNANVKRILILVAGWIFILLGIAGLFLPFLQGILFLLIGLYLLSHEYTWAARLLTRVRERYPAMAQKLDGIKARTKNWLRRK
ncbi:MAG: PGPGW domain-containing protein [Candidatus Brocadiaceae bacterium]|nr:PGPGW domain-containing protein [Candidatus Brocadiaceae bacterium]